MTIQDTLIEFLAYLYENEIDIRDNKNNWMTITKDFIEKNGCGNMTKAELKRALKLLENDKQIKQGIYSHTDASGKKWYK